MFFEGNEISALRRRKVRDEDLILLSVDENLDEFSRTLKLLAKTNPIQFNAALATLPSLARQDPA